MAWLYCRRTKYVFQEVPFASPDLLFQRIKALFSDTMQKFQNRLRQCFSTRLIIWYRIIAIIQRMTMDISTMSSWKRRVVQLIERRMRKGTG
jgi:hypothetical protein